MSYWAELATIFSGIAGLWTISFAWWTYVAAVAQSRQQEYLALRNTIDGLKQELGFLRAWSGVQGPGYSTGLTPKNAPPEWRNPSRIIWKFDYDAIKGLPQSPYFSRLRKISESFHRLSYSISRLFQFYDEYRRYVTSRPDLYDGAERYFAGTRWEPLTAEHHHYLAVVFDYNLKIHRDTIGGQDSGDPSCLYRAQKTAEAALDEFEKNLRVRPFPWWFWLVHAVSILTFAGGAILLMSTLLP